jgi:hypothetical protein
MVDSKHALDEFERDRQTEGPASGLTWRELASG